MATLPVKVSLQIVGNNIVSDDIYVKQYAVIGKVEKEFFEIKNTDGYLPINVAKMGSISHILAYSTNAKIKITTNTVPVTTPTVIEIPFNGKLYWEVPSTFSDLITSIEVATDSTTIVNAEISIWGLIQMSNTLLTKIKKYLMIVGAVVLVILLIVPLFMWWLSLRKNGKTISFTPEFKVIDIKNEKEEDLDLSKKTNKKAKEMLNGVNKEYNV